VQGQPHLLSSVFDWATQKLPIWSTRLWLMAGAHFDEMVSTKPPVDPKLPAAAMEQADRKSLRPESLPRSRTAKKIGIIVWLTAYKFLALPVGDCFR
jgi:hypothetical protein